MGRRWRRPNGSVIMDVSARGAKRLGIFTSFHVLTCHWVRKSVYFRVFVCISVILCCILLRCLFAAMLTSCLLSHPCVNWLPLLLRCGFSLLRSPPRKRPRNNRSHNHVGRAARRAALHTDQAGYYPYIIPPGTQYSTTDSQEPPLAHSPDTGDEPTALHG